MLQQVHNHVADTYAMVCGGSLLFGLSISQLNEYLQAGAFIVAIVSGSCAAYYYLKRAAREN
jgi:hypothetical protein